MIVAIFITAGVLGGAGDSCVSTRDCEEGLNCIKQVCTQRTSGPAAKDRAEYDAYMAFRQAAIDGKHAVPTLEQWRLIANKPEMLDYLRYRASTPKPWLELAEWRASQTPPPPPPKTEAPAAVEAPPPPPLSSTALDSTQDAETSGARKGRLVGGIIGGTLAAGAVVGGILFFVLRPSQQQIDAAYVAYSLAPHPAVYQSVQMDIDKHNTFTALGIASIGLGAALAATSVVLFATMPKQPSARVDVSFMPGGAALTLSGAL